MQQLKQTLHHAYERLANHLGHKRLHWLATLMLIGASAMAVRALFAVNLGHSALLYLLIPYGTALLVVAIRPMPDGSDNHWGRDVSLSSLVVFLASSIVLGEGFICVLFFLPFYFLALGLVLATRAIKRARAASKQSHYLSLIPMLVLALSFEGTTPALTYERANYVAGHSLVDLTPEQLLNNMEQPIALEGSRHWLLSIFPMPEVLSGHRLAAGERHQVYLEYPRWLVTNVHSGTLELELLQVSHRRVTARIRADNTLFANYLDLQTIEISFAAINPKQTAVTLAVCYERKLDPAWYFQPLMQFAVTRMAEHLIEKVIARG